jgi:molybdopterin-guanine dinucleotide biosynthesis protein
MTTVDQQPQSGARSAAPRPSAPGERIQVAREFPQIAAVVSVCGAASNAGKTWLCEQILRGLCADGRRTLALKVTRTHLGDCPRGVTGCGTCDSLEGAFEIVRDPARLDVRGKDTGRYCEAGADRVLWLLVHPLAVRAALLAVLAEVPGGSVLVAEGNSFRDYASADVSLLALSAGGGLKPSAEHVLDRVDACVAARSAGAPGRAPAAGRPLIRPAEAWPFVRERLEAAIRARSG